MNVKRAVPDTGTSRDHVTFSGQVSHRAKTPLLDSHLVHTDRNVADHDILATSLHLPEVCFTTKPVVRSWNVGKPRVQTRIIRKSAICDGSRNGAQVKNELGDADGETGSDVFRWIE